MVKIVKGERQSKFMQLKGFVRPHEENARLSIMVYF